MHVNRVLLRQCAVTVLVVLSLAASPAAQPNAPTTFANIHIDNFGKISDNYFRGAQPDDRDYADLAALGVRTVIDLTRDGRSDEPGLVERAGMKFYRIPMTTSDRPAEAAVSQFLKLVNDRANQPVYVHCQGGRHRTGVMTAVYRMTEDGWTANRAYAEMKQFNFEGFPGHPTLKTFVYDYYTQIDRFHGAGQAPTVAAVVTR
jgi:protein tyrosine/serine phosphatase